MLEISNLYVNLIVLSFITIALEGFIGGYDRYRLWNNLKRANKRAYKLNELNSQLKNEQQNSPNDPSSLQTTSNEADETRSIKENSKKSNVSRKDKKIIEHFNLLQIPTIYILAYICLIFIMLFITYYFRRIIKLYTFIYAILIGIVTFVFLYKIQCYLVNKCADSSKFKILKIVIYTLNLVISIFVASTWFMNRLNGCLWLFHNLLGVLVCIFCVTILRLINFRQIFITFSAFTFLDLFFVHLCRLLFDDISLTNSILNARETREARLDELNLEMTFEKNTIDRIPSIFFIPNANLISLISQNCINLNNVAVIGFGDLISAGIIASYCFYFDKIKKNSNFAYFLISIFASLIGLALMIFINDLFKANGQPVLVFIISINFILLVSLAYFKQELKEFWLNPLNIEFLSNKLSSDERSNRELYSNVNQLEEVV